MGKDLRDLKVVENVFMSLPKRVKAISPRCQKRINRIGYEP